MNYTYSKIWKRVVAICIDFLMLAPLVLLESIICSRFMTRFIINVIVIITAISYFSYFESSEKQATIGKKEMGIIVTDLKGNRLTVTKAMIRSIIKYLGSIIFLVTSISFTINIGILQSFVAIFTPKKQALHDLIAGSIVVDTKLNSNT